MRPAFRPIEAGATEGPGLRFQRGDFYTFSQKSRAPHRRQAKALGLCNQQTTIDKTREECCCRFSGEMIVAEACLAHGGIARAGACALEAYARGETHQRFDRLGDIGTRQVVVAMPPLHENDQQARIQQPGQMPGGRWRRNACFGSTFPGGQRLASHERRENVGARGITDQRRQGGDVRTVLHGAESSPFPCGDVSFFAETSSVCSSLEEVSRTEERHP